MDFCNIALDVIENEAQAVSLLAQRIGESFKKACQLLLACQGRVVVTGMGKSGHIAGKMAATFASTGAPAFFMHPGEANHGDLGMITQQDVVIALSHSGNTQEIMTFLPLLKHLKIPLISMTGNTASILAQQADVHLDVSIAQEACPLGLAPTTSTTVALVMGDALAVAVLQAKGFSEEDFARSHPGGTLGKKLLLYADDIAHQGDALPIVHEHITIREALIEVTAKKLGLTCVVDGQGRLCGIYTDGDIRRTLTKNYNIHETQIHEVMTKNCMTIQPKTLAVQAFNIMQQNSITALAIVNSLSEPVGLIHLHDLLKAGIY